MGDYDHKTIEPKWQRLWDQRRLFHAPRDDKRTKYYILPFLPYPSGDLHMGHMRNYTIGDAVARFQRARGLNVFHPIGWDAFGLPAENAAILNKTHPRTWTEQNTARMKEQLRRFGFSYDWEAELSTCEPEYYRWNQWFFLRMLEKGLAYRKKSRVNWCPQCQTVLANEQVVEGCCWRHEETPVEQRELEQWFLKTTHYAEELLTDLDKLSGGWPERIRLMQRNWIGKSEGARVEWAVAKSDKVITTFTTRLDTVYGAVALLLAPEHPLVDSLIAGVPGGAAIARKVEALRRQTRRAQVTGEVEKEGIFTGRFAVNPLSGEQAPLWVSNLVLMEYGTGAVQAVPAHDQRDFEFAKKYRLPIKVVVQPREGKPLNAARLKEAFLGHGRMVDSGPYTGMESEKALQKMTDDLAKKNQAERATLYRIKDWGISRQRYWGTPIPVVYCDACGVVPVPDEQLPVVLPLEIEFTGVGLSPLLNVPEFLNASCPKCGGKARRETDTMDTFVDSSWYFYRYLTPHENAAPFDKEIVRRWFPIDQYIGGAEHAVLHLIYLRFWTKMMRDLGLVEHDIPVARLFNQGMVIKDGAKMSKSRGNVVSTDEMVEKYGADTARLFTLFAAPPEKDMEWTQAGVEGCQRFLQRLYRLVAKHAARVREAPVAVPGNPGPQAAEVNPDERHLLRKAHQTVRRVTTDFEARWHFNTSIAAIMELVNELYLLEPLEEHVSPAVLNDVLRKTVLLTAPYAPHAAEELWEQLGNKQTVVETPWPSFDPELAKEELIEIVIQVNGRVRSRLRVSETLNKDELNERALADARVAALLKGQRIVKIVVVPRKLVNIVLAS
ncbi:MAG: leucine--tRNA ligase [Acidobacteria bacterium RIFCSPHIGHO2_12_FULL_67_30]|nr:MAG: leucine--tRNA ligase [Acidobacteria bacterium RIFCSPHIGHO2_01_FULL_67_28]OFV87860.1 MAG: leucine--tRNA ligase [Acidobacteria bacterium RIFCSPHIGHO2_12_FULL_67_30]